MSRAPARPLLWLAALLAVYLCAPFIASIPEIGRADWAGVDWRATGSAVGVSVASASVATLVILIGGVPLGYWLARSQSRAVELLGFVVQLPLALPPLTSGVLLLFLLGPYSPVGMLSGGTLTDSFTGIVLAETFVAAPFLIVAARSAFSAVDPVYDDVAATLGHRAGSRFFRATLPVAWPAIRAGLALAWLRAFGEFGATVMVAYHPYSLPVFTYVVFGSQGLPAMMPLLLPTLAIAVVCAVLSVYSRNTRMSAAGVVPHDNGDEPAAPVAAALPADIDELRLAFDIKRRLGAFSLDVTWRPATRRLAIIGPSGSGKSLALRIIAGLEPNDAGSVTLGRTDLGALPPERRQIGYMPQDYGLFPHMTVTQQLAFPVDADAASARYWIEHLGLSTLTTRLPRELSFGQRQRVALARALTRHSQLLLFDEPFAALDTPRRRRLQQSLRALQQEIAAVTVIVTHDPDEAAQLADEVIVIEHGRVLQAGSVHAVFERPATLRVADLLGLHNIGEGVVRAAGEIQTAGGLVLATADRSLATGTRVMWRVSPRALRATPDGAYAGSIGGGTLRHGDRYVTVEVGGESFDIAAEDAPIMAADALRFAIDPGGVSIWAAGS
ncbi:ABC transporter ATP-binding protein/permease [Paraburkholderia caballeronis]|uniref:Molybdate transport system permease protein n=1 Tax=Paraburkholderia caballeronis TaxID=416943 RepID=A0A1H7VTG5_9BURK|nr:ATP-binding cassette domain-containing protein [Paraburkholderia caballeronis]PXW15449.1 molybdate transport system permease protein [Paraburkholderia caballeronis]PXW93734.1 molybdate transport system permease protein [Paraburkholderia caballeronis]RAJ88974.1 molybdate transport system permease protein [Paraburkholderia caballeronis]SED97552.1 molybdate transport system permease protein [Paraburkholderia caballeronis]SEM12563.1 molybdate transport system permease protein [Paraburkholderia 